MASNYKHNSNDLTTEFQSAPSYLKDSYKINFTSQGSYEQDDDVMLVKSGVTALEGAWFTIPYPSVKYQIDSVPRPFVKAYGACIPNTSTSSQTLKTTTFASKQYWRWSNNYIQSSAYSNFSSYTNEKQSLTGLMFMEIQGAGGGGGGGVYTDLLAGQTYGSGGGGGGGAYISVLIDLSKFSYIYISNVGDYGTGGSSGKDGNKGGDTSVTFYYKSGGSHTFTAYGGEGGKKDVGEGGSGGTTYPSNPVNVSGIKILNYYNGKGGGKGGKAVSAAYYITATEDGESGTGFISTDTRYFGEIVDAVNISGGANNSPIWIGGHVGAGGGGASGLSKAGYGYGGYGGLVTWDVNSVGAVTNVKSQRGTSGEEGCILLYF